MRGALLFAALAACGGLASNATETPGRGGDGGDVEPVDDDADADADADADTDADTDADADADADSDADTDTGTPAGPLGVNALAIGDLVVSEVMHDPIAADDPLGEWFEILNVSGATFDLDGLEIRDDDIDGFVVIGTLLVGPGQRLVFAIEPSPAANGGVNVDYVGLPMSLANGVDELVLVAPAGEIDRIAWGAAPWPDPQGASMSLAPGAEAANDDGASWCPASTAFGAGDLGTPGAPNGPC